MTPTMATLPTSGSEAGKAFFRSNRDVAIHVHDLAPALRFYGVVMGFPRIGRSERHLVFDTGTFRLYVNRSDQLCSYVPSFDVPDREEARRRLAAAGCGRPAVGPSSYFEDPFGFVFDIIERR